MLLLALLHQCCECAKAPLMLGGQQDPVEHQCCDTVVSCSSGGRDPIASENYFMRVPSWRPINIGGAINAGQGWPTAPSMLEWLVQPHQLGLSPTFEAQ